MAGLNDVSKGEGAIPPETLKKLMAVYQANPSLRVVNSEGESGKTYAADPGVTVDGYTISLDQNTGKPLISKGLSHKTWGQDKAAVYNMDGTFAGYSSGDSEALSLGKFIAGSVGGYYGAGALNAAAGTGAAAGAGAGSLATTDIGIGAAAAGGGGGAAAATGAGLASADQIALMAANGMTDAEIAAVVGGQAGADLTGSSLAAAGGGLSSVDPRAAVRGAEGYGTEGMTGGETSAFDTGLKTAGTTGASEVVDAASKTKTVVDGWDQLAKIGTGLVGSAVVGDALSDPVDTSKFDQLFTNLLAEQKATSGRSADLWDTYQTTFKPLQQQFATTAAGFDTSTRRESAAQAASGEVAAKYDDQRMQAQREMVRAGVDPSTIYALGVSSRLQQAKDEAGAQNTARNDVEKTGLSLVKSAADMGSGLVSAANQSSQVATGTTQAASGVLTTQGNLQNQNTQNRNELVGDLFGAGLKLYGMSGG
jgi:hypothetical protein